MNTNPSAGSPPYDEDEAERIVSEESMVVFKQLQEIYCKNALYGNLEFIMGAPKTADEVAGYYDDAEGLLELFVEKVHEAREKIEASEKEEAAASLVGGGSSGDATEAAIKALVVQALSDAINGGGNDDEEDGAGGKSDAIPLDKIERLYATLSTLLADGGVEAGLLAGSLEMAAEAQRAEEAAATAEALRRVEQQRSGGAASGAAVASAEARRAAMKVSPEELFRMAQHVRSGLAAEADLLQMRNEDDDDDVVELNDEEPRFLKQLGLASFRRRINYRAPLPSQQLRDATTPQQRQNILDRLAQRQQGDLGKMNSMERTAQLQLGINADRRMIAKRAQQRSETDPFGGNNANNNASSGGGASEVIHRELDERPEEGGFRPQDLPSKLPPWMQHSFGKKPRFGLPQTNQSLQEQRRALPIFKKREALLRFVDSHNVTVLVGETGSGKTTQIPQYLAEHGYAAKGMICCTQPRRVAAETLAMRVAEEYGCRLGQEVGYNVRFRDVTSSLTVIKYMTDGMLLREALLDDSFARYSVIILDEAHERSINTDLLFAITRNALKKNPSLKVLVTSATLETEKFCRYFGTDEPFVIEGRTFPVETYYLAEPTTDYVRAALQTVMKIHLEEPPGDILVFFTGQEEIEMGGEQLHRWMEALRARSDTPLPDMAVLPLTATMPQEVQSRVFEATPPGCRKVVLATNVAETSITIGNLYYVIDSGYCKQSIFDAKKDMEQLKIIPISQAQAKQRAGRAGRIGPGKCYRMYTEEQFSNDMVPETVPDIMRANLFHVTLQLKAMGIDLLTIDLMDVPPPETIVSALEKLRYLEVLDDDGLLTPLGGRMAQLSIDPSQSKTLLTAVDMGCSEPVLTIVSMLAVQKRGVFYRPRDKQEEADAARRQFYQPEGDQLTLMAVYNAWVENGMSEEWSKRHFLKHRMLVEARDTRDQLSDMLARRYPTVSHTNDRNLTMVRKALTAGYFFHVAKRVDSHARSYVTLADRKEVYVHPSSVLMDDPPKYVLYDDVRMTNREYMMELLVVEPKWLVELAPAFYARPKERKRGPSGIKRRLTKEQEAEMFMPILKSWETGSSWRISKVKRQRK